MRNYDLLRTSTKTVRWNHTSEAENGEVSAGVATAVDRSDLEPLAADRALIRYFRILRCFRSGCNETPAAGCDDIRGLIRSPIRALNHYFDDSLLRRQRLDKQLCRRRVS
jgi:hypothetical protein